MTGPSIPMLTSEGAVPLNLDSLNADVKTTPFERRFNPYDFNGGYGLINLSYHCHIAITCECLFFLEQLSVLRVMTSQFAQGVLE